MAIQISSRKARFIVGAVFTWLLLVGAYAIWGFIIPHDFTFGPEIGPSASFAFFVVVFSVPYAVVALILYILAFSGGSGDNNGRGA